MFYARTSIFHRFFGAHGNFRLSGKPLLRELGGASLPANTVIPRDGNFDSHLKPMKDTYSVIKYKSFLVKYKNDYGL